MKFRSRSINSLGIRFIASLVLGLGVVGLAAHAQNTTTTYTPSDPDFADFDHHLAYTWRLDNIDLTGKQIVGASLSFDNIANWNNEANMLHIHLLDTARGSGIRSFYDDNPNNDNVTDLTDDFVSTRYHNGTDARGQSAQWLVSSATADTLLVNKSFTTTPVDYTLNFNSNQLSILTQYLLNGKNVAFGFDADCHYYNDGVKFKLITAPSNGNTNNAVPEAGTLSMLALGGIGLLGGIVVRRRK